MNLVAECTMNIVIRFQVEGFHNWPEAPNHRFYLRAMHRHLFYVEATIPVTHDDREIEYHDLLDFCKENFQEGDHRGKSCEQLAHELANKIVVKFQRRATVSVFEDGEVGSVVSIIPQL